MTRPAKDDPRVTTALSVVGAMRQKRTATHLSLRHLATIVGISFSELARLERGESLPSIHTQRRLRAWLTPETPGPPCPCQRCMPCQPPIRADVEARLRGLEARIVALETGNRPIVIRRTTREDGTP